MTHVVTQSYVSRSEADRARSGLESIGVPGDAISIGEADGEEAAGIGLFDRLAHFLLPDRAALPGGYKLRAEVTADQLDAAIRVAKGLPAGDAVLVTQAAGPGLAERVYEFSETAEEILVEKEAFVREEVVVEKLVETHSEQVEGVVRRTEVEVDRLGADEAEALREGERLSGSPTA